MKTINIIKKVFISAILLTIALAFTYQIKVNAAPDPPDDVDITIKGVSIRTAGNQGMRFKVYVGPSLNKKHITAYGVVLAYGEVDDFKSTFKIGATINGKTVISAEVDELDEDNCYYITLFNIPETGYMQNITVRAYCKYTYRSIDYGETVRVANLATIAYKAMNDGITSPLLTNVATYVNNNYKKVYVDAFDNLVFDDFYERDPRVLKELFINDLNKYTNTTLTTNSTINDWVTQLQSNNGEGNNNTDITDSKLYEAFNIERFDDRWFWLLNYLELKENNTLLKQMDEIRGQTRLYPPGYNNLKDTIYTLYNFFNCTALEANDCETFGTETDYEDLEEICIYPELENYDIRKIGNEYQLGHEDGVIGYTVNTWTLSGVVYFPTADYVVPSSNIKSSYTGKTCNVTYTISNNKVTITGLNPSVDISDLVILSKYEGYPVSSIEERALEDNDLINVTIQSNLTNIGDYAFWGCSNLETITLPNTLETIGEAAFMICENLTSLTIPSSVTSIGLGLTYGCTSLTNITVDSNNTNYDSRDNCNAIIETSTNTLITGCKDTIIPNTIETIGEYAFDACESLTSITIPSSVRYIKNNAFDGCKSLQTITIPNSVTSIEKYAFHNCKNLVSVSISENLKTIDDYTFAYCEKLQTVVIPDSVTSIGIYAFNYCKGLTSITIGKNVESIGRWCFEYCTSLTTITIPDSVTSIGNCIFKNCSNLTSITLSKNITTIKSASFIDCISLTSITIPDNVTSIESDVFWGCKSLTSITIPDKVTSIGNYAFYGCSGLTSVTIPSSVTKIYNDSFTNCTKVVFYCNLSSQPSGWEGNWNYGRPVNWISIG